MPATSAIEHIFSILHDGSISAWAGDKTLLTLTVDCQYLAERINKSFSQFYVTLAEIDRIELDPWTPKDVPAIVKTDLADIFEGDLEIMSGDIKDGAVVVTCLQGNPKFNYSGGNLTLSCQTIKVFDQKKNELTLRPIPRNMRRLLGRLEQEIGG